MNKLFLAISSLCAAATVMPAGAVTVITFDDITPNRLANFGPNFAIPPANYGGLSWTNTIVEPATSFIPGSLNLNVSAPNIATDVNYLGYTLTAAPIQFSSADPFQFKSAYFIANQIEDLNVTVNGLREGIIVDTRSFVVGTATPVLGLFNWTNVDTVIMSSSGGNNPTRHKSFSIDNVVISAVPEPASISMFLAGLGILAAVGRKSGIGRAAA